MRSVRFNEEQLAIFAENAELAEQSGLLDRYKQNLQLNASGLSRMESTIAAVNTEAATLPIFEQMRAAVDLDGHLVFRAWPKKMNTNVYIARLNVETGHREGFTQSYIGFIGKLTLEPYALENYVDDDVTFARDRLEVQTSSGIIIR